MASKRLPGKVLLPVNGVPVIDYVFSRVRSVKEINKVVLATTTNDDDPLIEFAENNSISYFRGSETMCWKDFTSLHFKKKQTILLELQVIVP